MQYYIINYRVMDMEKQMNVKEIKEEKRDVKLLYY